MSINAPIGGSPNVFPTPTVTEPSGTAPTISASESAAKSLNKDFDQFLLLLTTQLKNQDPLSPMDSTEFTNQLVNFSQVEQQIKTNASLTKMLEQTKNSETTLGLSYIGLNIDVRGNRFEYPGTGTTTMSYNLPKDASVSTISILDEEGNTVYSQSGELSSGPHSFAWDGTTNDGGTAPAGVYKLLVGALDQEQKSIGPTTTVPGYVSGIATAEDGSISLIIGRLSTQMVPMSSVTQASL